MHGNARASPSRPRPLPAVPPFRSFTPLFLRSILAALLPGGAGLSAADAVPAARLEVLSLELIKLRAETVRVETAWATERGLLSGMVQSMAERAAAKEDEVRRLEAKYTEEQTELAKLTQLVGQGSRSVAALEPEAMKLAQRLASLRPALPPRLSAALELPYRSLDDSEVGVSERLQYLTTILNRCGQFNRTITYGEEVLMIEPSHPAQVVEVIYWGLGCGFALDRRNGRGWLGVPRDGEWEWLEQPGSADGIARLIGIHLGEQDPDWVGMPGRITEVRP